MTTGIFITIKINLKPKEMSLNEIAVTVCGIETISL